MPYRAYVLLWVVLGGFLLGAFGFCVVLSLPLAVAFWLLALLCAAGFCGCLLVLVGFLVS